MNNGDLQEMLAIALAAKEAGFPRIQIDPADFIEVADQRNQLLGALHDLYLERSRIDNPKWLDSRLQISTLAAINRATGAA